MRDQAEKLRMKMLESQGALGRSIAVVSGKGGVGKSNFTTNFAATLASKGKKVVIVDMDIGMGNIHILIGKTVKHSLNNYLEGQLELEEVLYEGPNGLSYIAGGSGMSNLLEWSDETFKRLIIAFEQLQKSYDFILFDMGAGATQWSLNLLTTIDEIIVISTTEPTSIMDAYSMMKYIHLKDDEKKFYILCNRAFSQEEGQDTINRLKMVMERFLQKEVFILGTLPEDEVVRKSVKQQVPFSIAYPNASISKTIFKMVDRFIEQTDEEVTMVQQKNQFLTKLKSIFSKGRE